MLKSPCERPNRRFWNFISWPSQGCEQAHSYLRDVSEGSHGWEPPACHCWPPECQCPEGLSKKPGVAWTPGMMGYVTLAKISLSFLILRKVSTHLVNSNMIVMSHGSTFSREMLVMGEAVAQRA